MLKRNWALIALVYLVFAEALSLHPVPDLSLCLMQPEHSEQSSNHNDEKYCPPFHVGAALVYEKVDSWLERHDKSVIGAFTIVLAVSTIGLWLATNKLWIAGERQLSHLARTSEQQLRAYMDIIRGAIQPHQQPNGVPTVTAQVTFKNAGQTPAYQHRTWIGIRVEEEATFRFEFPDSIAERSSSIIGPGIESDMTIGFVIGQENLQAVLDGRKRLFVWGIVEYLDAFGSRRCLRFRCANGNWVGDRWPVGPYGQGYESN